MTDYERGKADAIDELLTSIETSYSVDFALDLRRVIRVLKAREEYFKNKKSEDEPRK